MRRLWDNAQKIPKKLLGSDQNETELVKVRYEVFRDNNCDCVGGRAAGGIGASGDDGERRSGGQVLPVPQ